MPFPLARPRRNRRSSAIRSLVRETSLSPEDFVLPIFVVDGQDRVEPIASMPGIFRLSIDRVVAEARSAYSLGIRAIALFPALDDRLKNSTATESLNPSGLLQRATGELKDKVPNITVITDVAMDPYSSDGHDGLVFNDTIDNDRTLDILAAMAVAQAQAGTDIVAPSDMMDGRVGHIRRALDAEGFSHVGIISYAVKYASACYGPFRDALNSAPRFGDKKTYQMDPANSREALREVLLDVEEGADMVMVKPAAFYLDIISKVRREVNLPVVAYSVSGEYAMVKAAGAQGWVDSNLVMMELLLSIKRAGADIIFTYFAQDATKLLG